VLEIVRATINELNAVSVLFNLYRIFYHQESNIDKAKEFIKERIENNDSIIFLAVDGKKPLGFTQLYPTFSSVSMKRTWILNDLYVDEEARRLGVAQALIQAAITHGKETSAKGILLETTKDNVKAQQLYEKVGFKQETNYFYFYSV
jgi:ribosomal protein S18 acetylase RimI-like enzyme